MGLKGQMGVPGSIERPRTVQQKKDAAARKKAESKRFEYFVQYRCTKCKRKSEDKVTGASASFCILCHIEGNGLNEVEETKGKRLKYPTPKPKNNKNSGSKKSNYKKKKPAHNKSNK